VLNPVVFASVVRWQKLQRGEAVADDRIDVGPPVPSGPHAILVGYGRVGSQLAALLRTRGMQIAAIDDDADLVAKAHADGLAAIRGNGRLRGAHGRAAAGHRDACAARDPRRVRGRRDHRRLRKANPTMVILARAHNEAEVRHLLDKRRRRRRSRPSASSPIRWRRWCSPARLAPLLPAWLRAERRCMAHAVVPGRD
jgi:CPA2 family monovalent cation:H+ antiporter-2